MCQYGSFRKSECFTCPQMGYSRVHGILTKSYKKKTCSSCEVDSRLCPGHNPTRGFGLPCDDAPASLKVQKYWNKESQSHLRSAAQEVVAAEAELHV
jgi:hypothetical protein